MADDRGSKWKKIVVIGIVVLVLLTILILFIVGVSSLWKFFKILIGICIVIAILFGAAYVFYILFIRHEYQDIPANYRKKLTQVARLMKNDMLGDLYLSGDAKHNRIKLGKYAFLRITLPKQQPEKANPGKEEGDQEQKVETVPVDVDCFVILKSGVMDKFFGDPIFVLVKPDDHDFSAIFNDVTLQGFNLVPLDSQFYTINGRDLDVDLVRGLSGNYMKWVIDEVMRDLDRLVKMSMNLDQKFQKEKQRGLEFEVPRLPGSGGDQNR